MFTTVDFIDFGLEIHVVFIAVMGTFLMEYHQEIYVSKFKHRYKSCIQE